VDSCNTYSNYAYIDKSKPLPIVSPIIPKSDRINVPVIEEEQSDSYASSSDSSSVEREDKADIIIPGFIQSASARDVETRRYRNISLLIVI
jgi:hypothetical protein